MDVPLDRFRPPVEERLAYQQFLLSWQDENKKHKPLAVVENRQTRDYVEHFFNKLAQKVGGIPSNLKGQSCRDVIDVFLDFPGLTILREANDEDALQLARTQTRGQS
ncbi:MAG: hypothetical protein M5R40_06220 [Anaerolineae bacterium]|nr:hypothetical protein [Anaerolineae bacterium]